MRLATFNILHGRSPAGEVDLELLAECVAGLDPDILALQEVDFAQERSGLADLTSVAAEAMGAVSQRFVAAIAGTPGAAAWMAATGAERPGSAGYGVALLSRYPALCWQDVRLPRMPVRFPVYRHAPGRLRVVVEEPRAAVAGRFATPLGDLTVANTHLSFLPGWNRIQLRALMREVQSLPGPHLVTGDLNMSGAAARRSSHLRSLASVPTFPAHAPARQIDHVLTDDPALCVTVRTAPHLPISDHRPLVVGLARVVTPS